MILNTISRYLMPGLICLWMGIGGTAANAAGLKVDKTSVTFTPALGTNPDNQQVQLTVDTGPNVSFQPTVSPIAPWLQLSYTGNTTPAVITLVVNSANTLAGTYTTNLTFTSSTPNITPATVVVTLTVGGGGGGSGSGLTPSTTALTFTSTLGTIPNSQSITVSATVSTTFTVSTAAYSPAFYNWLSVDGMSTSSFTAAPGSPATLTVRASPGSLTAGTYTGVVTLTTSTGLTTTINVTLNYGSSSGGSFTVSPTQLVLNAAVGASTTGLVTVTSNTGGNVDFTVLISANTGGITWLTASAYSGTATTLGSTITFTALASGLATGSYYGYISITATATGVLTQIPVTFNVGTGGGGGVLNISPTSLNFSMAAGGLPQSQSVTIQNSVGSYTATASVTTPVGGGWLTVTPGFGGTTPVTLTVTADPTGLGTGNYSGLIRISGGGTYQDVSVALSVGTSGSTGTLTVVPGALAFTATAGTGATPMQAVQVTYAGSSQQYTVTPSILTPFGGNWLVLQSSSGLTNGSFYVQANATGLSAGTYDATLTVYAAGQAVVVPVKFLVGTTMSSLSVSPVSLSLSAVSSGTSAYGSASVSSVSGATVGFTTTTSGASWLSVTSSQNVTPATLTITANPLGLSNGSYGGFITVTPTDGSTPQVIPVTFSVGTTSGEVGNSIFSVSPTAINFTANAGTTTVSSELMTVTSLTGAALTFTVSASSPTGGAWLSVDPTTGLASLSGYVTVRGNPAGLTAGTYKGDIIVTAQSLSTTVPVTITVSGPASTLAVSPTSLSFSAAGTATPPAQTLNVTASGGSSTVSYTASATSTGAWLSVSPTSGTTPANLTVSVNPAALQPGTYSGTVTITGGTSTVQVQVSLTVAAPDIFNMVVSPSAANLTARAGEPGVKTASASVSASNGTRNYSVTATPDFGGNWLTVSPASGVTPGTLSINASAASLSQGTYTGTVRVTMQGASNSPQDIRVTFIVSPRGPSINAVVHGAAYTPSYFSAGTLATIFGDMMGPQVGLGMQVGSDNKVTTSLGGTRVYFDNIAAPMVYASARQVSAIIPYGVAGRSSVQVVVEYNNERSDPTPIPLVEASPGIFTADSSGQGPGAILNQNGTFNTAVSGAAKGSVVSVYVTGSGQTTPPGSDGSIPVDDLPLPLLQPPSAKVGDQEAQVTYAGAAPGMVSGILQFNVMIPANARSGVQQILVRLGRYSSQLGVTVTVQ